MPGYPEQDELFKRMFERDKEDLRDLGVPLETGVNHPFDDDPGPGRPTGSEPRAQPSLRAMNRHV